MGMNHMDGGNGGPDGLMGIGGMGGPQGGGPMMGQNMLMRGLRPPGQGAMIRMSGAPLLGGGGAGAGHNHPFNNGPPSSDPSMFGPGAHQMFGGPKGGPGGGQMMPGPGGPPDASQPLPPSMGGAQGPGGSGPGGNSAGGPGGFKSQFVGPSTADPNYAQQYHNFQQQLYATSTRSQLNQQPGGGGPNNPNQSFFVPK